MGVSELMNQSISKSRSANYFKQVKNSFVYKGISVACSFLSIPLMISYLGQEEFGVWSTLLSILTWVTLFDLGLGNGLRNKLAEALAKHNTSQGKEFISSAYSLIALVSLFFMIAISLAAILVPWHKVFNTTEVPELQLSYAVWITGLFICLNFPVGLISSVLHAAQKSSVVVIGQLIFNFLSLVFVFCLIQIGHPSLIFLALLYGVALISSNILLSAWFYKKNPNLVPRFTLSFQYAKPLLGHGAQFFILQIAVLIIFTTDKIIISQIFGPEHVTSYDVTFKLFAMITLVYGLISAPVWSSYTEAFHQSDYAWIADALRKQLRIFLLMVLAIVCLIFSAQEIIALWIGPNIWTPMPLVVSIGLFVMISIWNNIYASFLNGIGRVKIQMYTAIIAMIINVPMAVLFAKQFNWGISGVVLATCLSLMLFGVVGPLETYRTLQKKGI